MIKRKDEGITFVSKNGFEYDLLEGMTIGGKERYTSDMIFIFFNDCDYNLEEFYVGYVFGATLIMDEIREYEETLQTLCEEYEKKNGLV